MYIHYNPNPRGLRVGDCAVRAASKAAGETWGSTYAALCALGYECGDMPNANHVWGRYLHERGFSRPCNAADYHFDYLDVEVNILSTFRMAFSSFFSVRCAYIRIIIVSSSCPIQRAAVLMSTSAL